MQPMTILEIVLKVVAVFLDLWLNRDKPEEAKAKAAARLTKELNDDVKSFDMALKDNDADAISAHFELVRRRVSQKTAGHSGNTGRP